MMAGALLRLLPAEGGSRQASPGSKAASAVTPARRKVYEGRRQSRSAKPLPSYPKTLSRDTRLQLNGGCFRGKRLCLMTFSWRRASAGRGKGSGAIESTADHVAKGDRKRVSVRGGRSIKRRAGDRSIGESILWAAEGGFVYALD